MCTQEKEKKYEAVAVDYWFISS